MKPRKRMRTVAGVALKKYMPKNFKTPVEEYHERRSGFKAATPGCGTLEALEARLRLL